MVYLVVVRLNTNFANLLELIENYNLINRVE